MATLVLNTSTDRTSQSTRGSKFYELSNHLGNVLATVSDMKLGYVTSLGQTTAEGYQAQVQSASDYYPFGWAIQERSFSTNSYRFGFNGKENDASFGDQIIQDYGFRLYNPAIGKFLSVDPLAPDYPSLTPYQFSSNSSIANIDLDGLEATQSITYKASNGTSLVLPSEATVVISTGDIANHPGATIPEGGNFGALFPQGTVGAFTVAGKEYRAAYDGNKFTGYYNPDTEQYYESNVLIDLPVISVFDGYQPLFDQADGAIFNDPLNGGANDLVQTADLLSDINPGKAAAGAAIGAAGILGTIAYKKARVWFVERAAYKTAKSGGKHAGFYKQHLNLNMRELRKSKRRIGRRIKEHERLIKNPQKEMEKLGKGDFSKLHPKHQEGLVNSKWPSDIKRQTEQRGIIKGIIKERKQAKNQ